MAKVNGVIPKKVAYVATKFSQTEIPTWDGEKLDTVTAVASDIAGVLDAKSKALPNMIARATPLIYGTKCDFPLTSVIYIDNEPMSVRILGDNRYDEKTVIGLVEARGVFWKVLMTKDCLVESVQTEGVAPGGYLNGEYVWIRSGSNTRLTRVGSKEYNMFLGETATRDSLSSTIKLTDLIPGAFYRTATESVLYCGALEFDQFDVELRSIPGKNSWQYTYETVRLQDVKHTRRTMLHSWIDTDPETFERDKARTSRYYHPVENNKRRIYKRVGNEIVDIDAILTEMRTYHQTGLKNADRIANPHIAPYEGNFEQYSITKLASYAGGYGTLRRLGVDVEMPTIAEKFKEAFTKK